MDGNVQVSILFGVISYLAGSCWSQHQAVLDSLECTCVAPICGNSTCQMVKLDEKRSNVTVGWIITQKLMFVKFRIRRRARNLGKKWSNADMDFTVNYCDFVKGANNPVVDLLVPGLRQALGDNMRLCPLQGWFLVKYTSDPGKKDVIGRPLGQLVKTEVFLVTINSQMFFKLTLLSKVL